MVLRTQMGAVILVVLQVHHTTPHTTFSVMMAQCGITWDFFADQYLLF